MLAEAQGRLPDAERLYGEAAERWGSYGFALEEAYALLALGRCRRAAGRAGEAQPPMRRAEKIFAKLGARPPAETRA